MNDATTTVGQLREMVEQFVADRNWEQYHTPKNLVMAMSIEVSELMEHFQWLTMDESMAVADDPATLSEVSDELADVICYALAIANTMNIDVAAAMHNKMQKNMAKYPRSEDDRPAAFE